MMYRNCLINCVFLFASLIIASLIFLQNLVRSYSSTKDQQHHKSLLTGENSKIHILDQDEKYISCTFKACSGIGNQMFRFASLYAIGKPFNREVFYSAEIECQKNYMTELKTTFPNMHNKISLLSPPQNETLKSDFGINCCKYYDPENFHDVPQKFLILNGNYFQSYKYFHQRKTEIREMFYFGQTVKDTVHKKGKQLFRRDSSHKLCIHIRRGDFLIHTQMESRPEFIELAIEFLYQNITASQTKPSKISLIFLGTDIPFLQTLKFNQSLFHSIHQINLNTRGEDMYFGIRLCDTLLITASGSTFAWWIGYLMPEGTKVFYNGQVSKKRNFDKDWYDFDYFPPEWIKLELDNSTKTIKTDSRWYYEKFGWPKNIDNIFNSDLNV